MHNGNVRVSNTNPAQLDAEWPSYEFRHPSKADAYYLVNKPLVDLLRSTIADLNGREAISVVDLGCGSKPYFPLFASKARKYIGIDRQPHSMCDMASVAESIAIKSNAFDVVMCTQVLEHVEDPARVLRECYRVCKPGGSLLLSTHGVFVYHPGPQDYWRWTHTGLRKIVTEAGAFDEIQVIPSGGTFSCFFGLAAHYLNLWLRQPPRWGWRMKCVLLKNSCNYVLNYLGEKLDIRFPQRPGAPHSLIPNYLVVAKKSRHELS